METKEFKIVVPEGYEIDKENSTLERIIFKKKDDRPRTWEEFCENAHFTGDEYYISGTGETKSGIPEGAYRDITHKCYTESKKEAEAFVALMQLRQLRKAWVGDWEPDWEENDGKYVIHSIYNDLEVGVHNSLSACMSFPDAEMAEEFMECFKDLLEQAKSLL